ncbi:MAG TPA: phosphoribosylanthranilate isomerase [Gammaproteobacteria bacterium]
MFVKICGITSAAAADAAAEAGADAVGFVLAPSPRQVTVAQARELGARLPRGVLRVAVLRRPEADLVARVLDELEPDWLQADAEDFAAIRLPAGCTALPVYRTGRAPGADEAPGRLLFESPWSGSGRLADWDEARALAEGRELILAGGLDAANVEAAIRAVRPWGVDVSTGVERAPGEKDPDKIKAFVACARRAGRE